MSLGLPIFCFCCSIDFASSACEPLAAPLLGQVSNQRSTLEVNFALVQLSKLLRQLRYQAVVYCS